MIWHAGRIMDEGDLRIGVLDRTFEHGLGLFETFRTWRGHPTLLDRHLVRLGRSARALGIPLDPASLPDPDSVAALLRAESRVDDAVFRITLTGGNSSSEGSTLWMRAASLPTPPPDSGARLSALEHAWEATVGDPLARHKTLNYWHLRLAHQTARARGEDEVLGRLADGSIVEGSRTNVFVVVGGAILTPDACSNPLLPGIFRGLVLDWSEKLGRKVREVDRLVPSLIEEAEEILLTNSVRGVIPVGRCGQRRLEAPGPTTRRLWEAILPWLDSGGNDA